MKLSTVVIVIALLLPQVSISEIRYFKNVDDFTEKDASRVLVTGNNEEIALVIQCLSDELRMLFYHEELIGNSDDQVKIAYKLGDNAPSDFNYSNLLNPRSMSFLGVLDSSRSTNEMMKYDKSLLGRLQGVTKLSIRIVDPYDNRKLTTTFSLDVSICIQN